MPAVSVVIPAYNAARFIEPTLESLDKQTFRDFEVIVIDDGSKDDTEGVVNRFLASRNLTGRCLRQANKKIAAARNAGIHAAQGSIVTFLDHDDTWRPRKLARVIEEFNAHPDAGLVFHSCQFVEKSGRPIRLSRPAPMADDMYAVLLFLGNFLCTSAVSVKRDLLTRAAGFRENPEFDTVEDYDLWLRLAQQTRFKFVNEVLADLVHASGSASSRIQYHHGNEEALLSEHFRALPSQSYWTRALIRRRLGMVQRHAARGLMASGDFASAGPYVGRMLGLFPFDPKSLAMALLWGVRFRSFK